MKRYRSTIIEWLLGGLILLAVITLTNPMGVLMSFGVEMSLVIMLALAVIAFGIFFWRERPVDEREAQHGLVVARAGFFVGGGALLLAIGVQALAGHLDPWLPAVLASMVVAKLIASAWLMRK